MNTNRIAVLGALFLSYIFLQLHLDEQHRGHHRLVRRAVSRDSVLSCASVSCIHGVYVGCNTTGGRDCREWVLGRRRLRSLRPVLLWRQLQCVL